jgi:hypothetical protein
LIAFLRGTAGRSNVLKAIPFNKGHGSTSLIAFLRGTAGRSNCVRPNRLNENKNSSKF